MKRLTFIAALFIALVVSMTSCSKDNIVLSSGPVVDTFYSRIRIFTDGRQPGRDTVTTIKVLNRDMYDQFALQDGKIIEQTSTYFIVGRIWMREY